jgi:SAM-dependent methyltransferase
MPSIEWNKCWGKQNLHNVSHEIYGFQWGNPLDSNDKNSPGDLSIIKKEFIECYIDKSLRILEIGPGGGRWTQFFFNCKRLYLLDLNCEFFDYIKKKFPKNLQNVIFLKTNGSMIPDEIQEESIDFIFSFGCFVHLEQEIIKLYMDQIYKILDKKGIACIQYADSKKTKIDCFSNMNEEKMLSLLTNFRVLKHDKKTLSHSNVIAISKKC